MQSIPFYIAYLLTRHESVVVPDFGAFVVFQSDKEKNKWGVLSPPENLLEFYSEIKHNDGLLSYSIAKVEKCSTEEAEFMISRYVSSMLQTLNQGKAVDIPWVGRLYFDENIILFQPDKVLSCNALNYGLISFSMPCLTELMPVMPPDNEQDSIIEVKEDEEFKAKEEQKPPVLQTPQGKQKEPNKVIPVKKEDKNIEIFNIPVSRKIIIYASAIAAALLAIFFMPTPLSNGYFTPDQTKYASIINFPIQDTDNEETDIEEDEIQEQDNTSTTTLEEKPVQNMETALKKETTPVKEITFKKEEVSASPGKIDDYYYYIVVSSLADLHSANVSLTTFQFKGFKNAAILISDGKYRIYTDRFDNKEEAERSLVKFRRDNPSFSSAWLLREKR